jgi:hypothetical protein
VASAAGINDGCNSRADTENIRIGAEGPKPVHQVKMNIDQSRCNDKTIQVNNRSAIRFEIGANGGNDAITDMNVVLSVETACRVEEAASFEDKIG